MPRNTTSDDDLMRAAAQGEDSALSELMQRHRRWVFSLVQAFVHHREAAEDLTQEVFVRIHRHAADYVSEGRFLVWLKRIAINLAKDYLRQQRQITVVPLSEREEEALQEPSFDPVAALMSEALAADMRNVIQSLPEEQRLAVVMRYFGDMSVPDIAWAMQRPEGTIKSRLFYGLRHVRQKLIEMWEKEVRPAINPSGRVKMTVTNYYSFKGEIIGEKTTGGQRIDYLTDALGSVTATVNQSAQVINTYRYKPYGAQLAKTGVGADPSFGWVGTQGYRKTGRKFSDFYVRARHYSSDEGRWNTKDPIGYEDEDWNLYYYGGSNPVYFIDPEGKRECNAQDISKCKSFCRDIKQAPFYKCEWAFGSGSNYILKCKCKLPCRLRQPCLTEDQAIELIYADAAANGYTLVYDRTDTAYNCGSLVFNSYGTHSQWLCCKGGSPEKRVVATVQCCRCWDGLNENAKSRICCSANSCHRRPLPIPSSTST